MVADGDTGRLSPAITDAGQLLARAKIVCHHLEICPCTGASRDRLRSHLKSADQRGGSTLPLAGQMKAGEDDPSSTRAFALRQLVYARKAPGIPFAQLKDPAIQRGKWERARVGGAGFMGFGFWCVQAILALPRLGSKRFPGQLDFRRYHLRRAEKQRVDCLFGFSA